MEKIIHYFKKPLGAARKLPLGREHLLENFDHKNERHLYLAVLFSLFCVTVVSSIVVFMFKYEPSNAQKAQPQASVKPQTETEFLSNEILVKVKKTVKARIKEGKPEDTGLQSLNKLNHEEGAQKFEKVIKTGGVSNGNSEISGWYMVNLGGKSEVLKEDLSKADKKVNNFKTQTSPLSKEDKVQKLKSVLGRYKKDPNIEAAEFNFIVHADQVPTPTPTPLPTPPTFNPGCTLSIGSIAPGGTVIVTSVNSLFGSIGMQGSYGTPVYSNLGFLNAGGSTPIVVPIDAQSGLYTVRVGGFGVGCTPNLSVTGVPTPTPIATPIPTPIPTPTPTLTPTPIPTPTPTPPPLQLCPTTSPNIPNDPYSCTWGTWGQAYPDLWGIKKINAQNAWKESTGSAQVVVAVVDTGVDRNHEDIASNMWINSGENGSTTQEGPTPNCTSRGLPLDKSCNNLDDDNNGYIDDTNGWDYTTCAKYDYSGCAQAKLPGNNPMDGFGHGTHVAGTIGAVGNNGIGIVGVNWNVKVMAVKGLNDQGTGTMLDLASGITYAVKNGAKVVNLSLGCQCDSGIISSVIRDAHDAGVVVVVAAGNSNDDAMNFTPASLQDVITVAATDSDNARATFSNWGPKIDVAAPGVDILSLRAAGSDLYLGSPGYTTCGKCFPSGDPNAKYYRASGTSMATPHVAGLAALLLAKNPNLRNEQVRQILRSSATDLGSVGFDTSFGYGLINAQTAINNPSAPFVFIKSPVSKSIISGTVPIIGEVSGANIASYSIKWTDSVGDHPIQTSETIPTGTNVNLATWDTTMAVEGQAKLSLTVTDTSGKNFVFNIESVTVDNVTAQIDSPAKFISKDLVNISGSAFTAPGVGFSKYVLEYGEGTAPTSWVNTGIVIANGGSKSVSTSALGTWDTRTLSAPIYTLRLTVTDAANMTDVSSIQVFVDPDLVPGWPKLLMNRADCHYGGYIIIKDTMVCQAYPVTADFDNDGQKEILVVGPDDFNQTQVQVQIFRRDGSLLPGWPINVSGRVQFAPNVADIDKDGYPEIILTTRDGHIYVYDYKGQIKPGWSNVTINPTLSNGINWTDEGAAVGDINKDGNVELVTVDGIGLLHEFNSLGQELSGFPKQLASGPQFWKRGPITLADINGDGFLDVSFSEYSSIYAYNSYNGNLLPGWPYRATPSCVVVPSEQNLKTALAVGDLRKDGWREVAALGVCGDLYLINPNGTSVPGWPIHDSSLDYSTYTTVSIENYISPIIADINGPKVIFGSMNGLVIADINGIVRKISSLGWIESLAAVDANNDGKKELFVVTQPSLYLIDEFGNQIWKRDNMGVFFRSGSSVIDDLNGDGQFELVAASEGLWDSFLFVWQLPFGSNTKEVWSMVQHDSLRGGSCLGCAPTVSITNPTNGSTVNGSVNITADAGSKSGVSKVEFWIDGKLQGYDNSAPYMLSWDTTKITNGSHTVKVKAYDLAGDSDVSTVTVTVNLSLLDSDNDGFTDSKELFMGTDPNKVCGMDAWPPDIDGDGAATILDLTRLAQAYGSKAGDAKYKARYDMDADGAITILDLSIAGQYFTSKCTNPVKTK